MRLKFNSQETINYKTSGWFAIDTVKPETGMVFFSNFDDNGRNASDEERTLNDVEFTLEVDEGRNLLLM